MIINMLNEMRQKQYREWSLLHYFAFVFITLIGIGGGMYTMVGLMLKAAGFVSWVFVFVSLVCALIGLPCFFFVNTGKW